MTVGKNGSYTITCGGMGSLLLTLHWQEHYDTAANSSVLSVTGITMNAGVWAGRYTINGTIAVDGTALCRMTDGTHQVYINTTGTPADETNGNYPCRSNPIPHDDDGRKTVRLSVNLSGGNSASGGHWYASGAVDIPLTDIPRLSAVSAPSGYIGSRLPVTIRPASLDFTHSVSFLFGGDHGIIAENLRGGAFHWAPPLSLCAQLPDAETGTCTLYCDTYRDDVFIGRTTCEIELCVPLSVGLQFTEGWAAIAPDNSGTAAEGLGLFVQGCSRAAVTVDESKIDTASAYGAVYTGCALEIGGGAYGGETLHVCGEQTMTLRVTDSRGRVQTAVLPFTVHGYAPPVIADAQVLRCMGDGTPDDEGSCVLVTAAVTVSPLDGSNTGSLSARLRSVGGAWSAAETVESGVPAVLWSGGVSPRVSYEVELTAGDSLGGAASVTVLVPTADVLFHARAGGGGAAFGKYAEADGLLDIAWGLQVRGGLTVGGKPLLDWVYPVGAVYVCVDGDPGTLFGGTWTALEDADGVKRWVRTE